MLKALPTNTATFRKIIQGNFVYIDKTQHLYELVYKETGAYFLARPRRFGKSLLISTLDELFQGNRELFRGLWIDNSDYVWETHPVIRIDLSRHPIRSPADLERSLRRHLQRIARQYGISLPDDEPEFMLEDLIFDLSEQNQVVILIDEYDKPIIDHLEDVETAIQIRDRLQGFYTVIKSMEADLRLVFITGISKFSKISIFSELNNLTNLTFDGRFATILGITQAELNHYFADHLPIFAAAVGLSVEALLDEIRHWYNGFRFTHIDEPVYNPFSTMLLFEKSKFHHFWFESGTPSFLIRHIHQQNYPVEILNSLEIDEIGFNTYDIEQLALIPLLFQTGYLTVKGYDAKSELYTLDYPNYEVENAFLVHILDAFSNLQQGLSRTYLWQLIRALRKHDLETFFTILKVFFAQIDYDLHVDHEKYYQTIFYVLFTLIGVNVRAEVKTNQGRIDAVVEVEDYIYIFEFKLNDEAKAALAQIKKKAYFEKYWLIGKPITLIGANFNSKTRQVDDWKQEKAILARYS